MVEIHGNSARLFKLLEDDTVSASEYLEIMASGTLNFNERDTKSADLRRGDNIRDLNFDEGNSNYF